MQQTANSRQTGCIGGLLSSLSLKSKRKKKRRRKRKIVRKGTKFERGGSKI
jgi:hypothetical protein